MNCRECSVKIDEKTKGSYEDFCDKWCEKKWYDERYEGEPSTNSSSAVIVMEHRCYDGSKLDSPISKNYMENIKSRSYSTADTTKTLYPGRYGS